MRSQLRLGESLGEGAGLSRSLQHFIEGCGMVIILVC
jgi:hypothetical protein